MKKRKQIFKTFVAILIMLSIVTESLPMYARNINIGENVINEELENEVVNESLDDDAMRIGGYRY